MKKILILSLLISLFAITTNAYAAGAVAVVDGKEITNEDVMAIANQRMAKLLSQMYQIKRAAAEQLIDDYLLEKEAKKQGITKEKLEANVVKTAGKVTETEAKSIYAMNKRRFKDKEFSEVKSNIMAQMTKQKEAMAMQEFLDGLRKKANIKFNMQRPRFDISVDDDAGLGNKNAPVVLIEFSDFQCPYCNRVRPTIKRLLNQYKGKLYYVFRDYPLSFHKQAKDAANAAECAGDQGKYMEYNAKIWDGQRDIFSKNLSHEDFFGKFKSIAKELKLNQKTFDQCLEGKKHYAEIEKDMEDGMASGVTGTPAYFINGVFLSGAQPYEAFAEIIEEELEGHK